MTPVSSTPGNRTPQRPNQGLDVSPVASSPRKLNFRSPRASLPLYGNTRSVFRSTFRSPLKQSSLHSQSGSPPKHASPSLETSRRSLLLDLDILPSSSMSTSKPHGSGSLMLLEANQLVFLTFFLGGGIFLSHINLIYAISLEVLRENILLCL